MKKRKPNTAKNRDEAKCSEKHGDKESTKRHVYVEPGTEINFTENLRNEYHTANTQADTYNHRQFVLAIISAVLIALYAAITLLIYCANKKAADAATLAAETAKETLDQGKLQFRNQQRPYIFGVPYIDPKKNPAGFLITPIGNTGDAVVDFVVGTINRGQTPAIDVHYSHVEIRVGTHEDLAKLANYVPDYLNKGSGDILAVTQGDKINTLAPNNPQETRITANQLQLVRQGKLVIYAFGGIEYRDVYLPKIGPYQTLYCYIALPEGSFHYGGCSNVFAVPLK